jgi:hypothetical protein
MTMQTDGVEPHGNPVPGSILLSSATLAVENPAVMSAAARVKSAFFVMDMDFFLKCQ